MWTSRMTQVGTAGRQRCEKVLAGAEGCDIVSRQGASNRPSIVRTDASSSTTAMQWDVIVTDERYGVAAGP
jgi:hypothetical protein